MNEQMDKEMNKYMDVRINGREKCMNIDVNTIIG